MRIFRLLRPYNYDMVQNQSVPDHLDIEENQNISESERLLTNNNNNSLIEEEETCEAMASPNPGSNEGGGIPTELQVELPPPKPDMHAPPPYEEVDFEGNPSIPPFYDHSSSVQPPSYEEVQRQKALEAGEESLPGNDAAGNGMQVVRISSLGSLDSQTAEIAEEQLLGTDLMFFVAFTAAFLFNLVGIVLLLCLCHTVAGRAGALAGFGLSLAKWVVIFRHSTDLVADSNSWLLWLIMVLGLLICVRAILQYINAKREWHQLPHNSRHRFFLFY